MPTGNITKSLFSIVLSLSLAFLASLTWAHDGDARTSGETAVLTAEEQEIADVLAAYAEAFASGDMQRIESFFLADERLSYFEGSFVDWGWASYRNHLAEEFPLFSETRYTIKDIRPQLDNNLAFATFSWNLDVTVMSDQFPGGRHPVSSRGVGTVVLNRDDDRWRIRHMHTAREARVAPEEHSGE